MANQREIAAKLGITQAAVSMALRGDRRISAEMRQRVRDTAKELDYHPHAYVNVLMSHIRSGKKLSDKGVIAMMVEGRSEKVWHNNASYRLFHEGLLRRSDELGFRIESFFLGDPEVSPAKVERILRSRGIQGLILGPPYRGDVALNLHWERYAAVAVGYGWPRLELDRVVYDHYQNFMTAFHELRKLGYRRIGTVLHQSFVDENRRKFRWYSSHLECQSNLQPEERIPILRNPHFIMTGLDKMKLTLPLFRKWYRKWKPDALLTLGGLERDWLIASQMRTPEDIGLACLAHAVDGNFAQMDEKAEEAGAAAVDIIASKIARNEIGPSSYPRIVMIQGRWKPGSSLQKVS